MTKCTCSLSELLDTQNELFIGRADAKIIAVTKARRSPMWKTVVRDSRSSRCSLRLPAYRTEMIGKMRIKCRPFTPFGVRCVKRLKRDGEYILNKELRIHFHQPFTKLLWGRCKPLFSHFYCTSRRCAERMGICFLPLQGIS